MPLHTWNEQCVILEADPLLRHAGTKGKLKSGRKLRCKKCMHEGLRFSRKIHANLQTHKAKQSHTYKIIGDARFYNARPISVVAVEQLFECAALKEILDRDNMHA